jgi:SsrA-binding protein
MKPSSSTVTQNRKATHDYFIEERFEAGLVLQGWEIKAIRQGRAQINDAYILVRDGELFLLGAHITPLLSTSTHYTAETTRTRKLLMQRSVIDKLIGKIERAGYTLIPLDFHFSRQYLKASIGLAKGKKQYDKRQAVKEREWNVEKQRLLRFQNKS